MTEKELIYRATELLGGASAENPWLAREGAVKLAVSYALHKLATTVAKDAHRRHLLQNTYEVTVTSGAADLYDATDVPDFSAYGAPLAEAMCYSVFLDADSNRYTYLSQYRDLLMEQPVVFGYYTLTGQRLKIRELDSGALDASGSFTLVASFVPTVAQIKAEIEDDAVKILAGILAQPMEADAGN